MNTKTPLATVDDIRRLRESSAVECKAAQGRDGNGELPHDVWETISAFANTDGGDIFLGLAELPDESYQLVGINDTAKVLQQLHKGLSTAKVINYNPIPSGGIALRHIDGKTLIQVSVPPRADAVYVGNDPSRGRYRRVGSADHRYDAVVDP